MLEEDNNMMRRPGGANAMPWVILAVVLLVFVVAGVLFRDRLFPSHSASSATEDQSASSGYQAVFLTNGQVYFGKLSGMTASYATLKDIYYLQVTTPPANADGSQLNQQQQAQNQQLSLVKLGQELHGPVDEMKINRDQVLFYEDIKEDGRVMKAIREYQKNPPAAANSNTNTAPQTQVPTGTAPAVNTTPKK
ncbi:MAG TPA: hypothetical protein VHQ41_00770 [Patescibacteria group bacterium]|jgi:hypothetical protein|nr:hypothetical protein [Patescibacteria group bacterium]